MGGNLFKSLPLEIGKLTNLTTLNVGSNQLSSLPHEIFKLTNLTELYLSDNQLISFPPEIFELTNLTELDLSDNQLSSIPLEIDELTNLTTLNMGSNQLSSLPLEIGKLTNLTTLNVGSNQLSSLPHEIGKLTNLTELYLSDNQLISFPPEIFKFMNLTELDLSDNQLSSLPHEILKLTNLTTLNMGNNQLSSFPPEIFKLTNLTELDLSYNQLSFLPPEIVKLTNLTELTLEKNPLKSPPSEIVDQGIKAIFEYILRNLLDDMEVHARDNEIGKKAKIYTDVIKMPQQFRTSIKQYLIFFNDFVNIAKGKDVNLEVHSHEEGLELIIGIDVDNQIDEVHKYLSEYVGFIKQKIDDIHLNLETNITPRETELLIVELRNQIRNLHSSMEIKMVANKFLEQERDKYYELLVDKFKNPNPIILQLHASPTIIQNNTIELSIKNELPVISSDFEKLKDLLIQENPELEGNLKEIGDSLDEVNANTEKEKLNKPFNKVRRFLEKLDDEKSDYNKIISATEKGIALAQKLGKNYNKVAQYLALPQVPDLFLKD